MPGLERPEDDRERIADERDRIALCSRREAGAARAPRARAVARLTVQPQQAVSMPPSTGFSADETGTPPLVTAPIWRPYGDRPKQTGMMQALLGCYAQSDEIPGPDEPRGLVDQQDALDAVIQLAASIDELTQSGTILADRGMWMASLLMLIREHVKSLPTGEVDGEDLVNDDLQSILEPLRQVRRETGLHG